MDILFLYLSVFIYGIFHSLTPGHGKMYLLSISSSKNKSYLLLISFIIAYVQGIISCLLVKLVVDSMIKLKMIDIISQNFYGVTLILLSCFNLYKLKYNTKGKEMNCFLLGTFVPCSGIISVLFLGYIYKKIINFYFLMFWMSSGVFLTLAIFSLLVKKLYLYESKNSIGFFNIAINILVFVFGWNLLNLKHLFL